MSRFDKEVTITVSGVSATGKTSMSSLFVKALREAGFTNIIIENDELPPEEHEKAYLNLDAIRADERNAAFWSMPIVMREEHITRPILSSKEESIMTDCELAHFRARGNFLPLMEARDVAQFFNSKIEIVSGSKEIEADGWAYMTLRNPKGEGVQYLAYGIASPGWHIVEPWEKK